ncbi:hypothetical protein ACFSC6_03040 [Rufibacter sediminis]|uniref:Uncharacterized protein n=1 Tax=Rufibacter sediminis TaxID=2762756 RepID=A0ABR6VVA1_9BACT|nr:hypothetical protein [Rufibacter sediminis]MBC3541130.1 hypothetical protein [Rufibacter sediminis]
MKLFSYTKLTTPVLLFVLTLMVSCSVLTGGGYSSDPLVAEQQRRVESLKAEVKQAEQETEAAEEREKAAKSRLKAAQDELKVFQTEAKRRGA